MSARLNWWIGVIFAIGSLHFVLASLFILIPSIAQAWSVDSTTINVIYFLGSIPFTTAAYLQLFQAANDSSLQNESAGRHRLIGWYPSNPDWMSTALQFVGTILFNINTFDAMIPSLDWLQEDLLIWAPDVAGSVLFLTSGYIAYVQTCHGWWSWNPANMTWWIVFTNLVGCVCFMISALFAVAIPGGSNQEAVTTSVLFTLLGAVAFLIGSLLMLPDTRQGSDNDL